MDGTLDTMMIIVKSVLDQAQYFELNPFLHWQPIKLMKDGASLSHNYR